MKKSFSLSSFFAGLVIGAGLMSAWYFGNANSSMSITSLLPLHSLVATSTVAAQTSTELSVATQPPGDTVVVESVTVPPPGVWVAVRELSGTTVGNVLGAARVGGPRSNITIPLLRATQAGSTYAVELYRDDNNSPTFDLDTDSVYVDFTTDQPVIVDFNTTN